MMRSIRIHISATCALAMLALAVDPSESFASDTAQLIGITRDGQVVDIDIDTGAATPLFTVDGGGALAFDPATQRLVLKLGDDADSQLVFIDPTTGQASPPVGITGLPPDFENVATVGYSGQPGMYVLPAGPTGTVFEDRLVLVDDAGVVQDVSVALGLGDNDGLAWDDLNARIVVHDYNASDGFPRVAAVQDPFGVPMITALAEPPSRSDVGDSAIDPFTGRLFTSGFDSSGGFLVEVLDSSYVDIGSFGTAEQVVGIAFVWDLDCRADLDGDGDLTIFDFLAFQNLFDAGDTAADFDGDGELTIFDFLAFQNAFDAGCPSALFRTQHRRPLDQQVADLGGGLRGRALAVDHFIDDRALHEQAKLLGEALGVVQPARLGQAADDAAQGVHVRAGGHVARVAWVWKLAARVDEQAAVEGDVGEPVPPHAPDLAELVERLRAGTFAEQLGQALAPPLVAPLDAGQRELFLALEVLVERRLGGADLGEDLVEPGGVEAPLIEQVKPGCDQPLARVALARLGAHGASEYTHAPVTCTSSVRQVTASQPGR